MNRNSIADALYPPDNRLIYALIFGLIVLVHGFINQFHVPNMDEIWNYQFARRILYGQIPYRDFLMLHTPFSAQINALILYLFSDKLIVMRWIAACIAGLNGVVFFVILRLLGKTLITSSLYTSILVLLFLLNPQNNYSWYAVLFLSLALLTEVLGSTRKGSQKLICDFVVGMCMGAVTITKQNIGVAGLIAAVIFSVYDYRTREKREHSGQWDLFRSLLSKTSGWGVIVAAELWWLQANAALYPALHIYDNLTSFTSHSFTHFSYWAQSSYAVLLFFMILVIIMAAFLMAFDRRNITSSKRTLLLLALYSSANFAMVYPIPDPAHIWFGMPLSIIILAVLWDHPIFMGIHGRGIKFGLLVVLIMLLFIPLQGLQKQNHYDDLKHYERIPLYEELYENTVSINEFILDEEERGQDVFVLNYQAPRFLIPLDKFSYRYDTLLTCDLGSKGENDIIEVLSSSNDITVLIAGIDSEKHRRFESQAIQDYVRGNMRFTDHMYGFDIYTR